MTSRSLLSIGLATAALAFAPLASAQGTAQTDATQTKKPAAKKGVQSDDLYIKKTISVGGNAVSSTETSIHGARERTVSGTNVTLRQCDLKRTITLNDQAQTYLVNSDPSDESAVRAAALATGTPTAETSGGKITVTSTVTDTGERKVMYGYQARHLKAKVSQESSADACTKVNQSFEIDGWFADVSKEYAACSLVAPPVQPGTGCHDTVISRHVGSGKPGYPLQENISMPAPDGSTTTVTMQVSELTKQELSGELFEVPSGYKQVSSMAELKGAAEVQTAGTPAAGTPPQAPQANGGKKAGGAMAATMLAGMMNPAAAPAANQIMQQQAMSQLQQYGMTPGNGMPGMGMPGTGMPKGGTPVAAPQALGHKAPGKIRVGIAPPDAQMGQGSKSGADYSTPIRNAIVALMNGPAVEIAALDAHIPLQLQAEAQQKECDFIFYSGVTVKHASGGGLGGFLKKAAPIASMTPMGGMARGMGGAVAASAASAAASAAAQAAQQQAMSQLAGFNGEIKSKDDVTVQYQLVGTGQASPVLQNTLQGKAKSDGEDVLTPLLQQAATNILTEVTKK